MIYSSPPFLPPSLAVSPLNCQRLTMRLSTTVVMTVYPSNTWASSCSKAVKTSMRTPENGIWVTDTAQIYQGRPHVCRADLSKRGSNPARVLLCPTLLFLLSHPNVGLAITLFSKSLDTHPSFSYGRYWNASQNSRRRENRAGVCG